MKIIGVLCGIICVGTLSTLALKSYMETSINRWKGGFGSGQVQIVERETETGASQKNAETAAQTTEEETILPEDSLAGMAQVLAQQPEAETIGQNQEAKAEPDSSEEAVRMESEAMTVTAISLDTEEELLAHLLSGKEAYMEYLGDIELQVLRVYAGMEDASIQEKTDAENYAYRLWDDELNRIYPILKRSMTQEEGEALKMAERQWIKDRDTKAQRDSASANSEAARLLAYTRSQTITTKVRTYELVEQYFQLFEPTE